MSDNSVLSNALWQSQFPTTTTSGATNLYGVGQPAPYMTPPNWYFPCGHQIKLEQGQPYPQVCEKCGPLKYENYTYKKCGHVYSHQAGSQIPSECPTCALEKQREVKAAATAAALAAAEEERLRAENKDLRVWLDREVSRVREPIAA